MKKGTLVAVGVFAALLLLFLATRESQVSEGVTKLDLRGVDKDRISSVEFSGTTSATLRKEGEAWVVVDPARPDTKYPADEAQVRSVLNAVAPLKSAELVTDRAEKHAEFEVDDANARKVRLLSGSGSATELLFGRSARGGSYIRKAGSNAVFVTQSELGWMARRELNFWRQRAFMALKQEEISQVTVRPIGAEPYTLKAGDDGAWTLAEPAQPPAGFRFDAQVARSLVQYLSTLAAQDFAQGVSDDAVGLAGTHDVIEARLKDGKTVTLHLGVQAASQDSQDASVLKFQFDTVDAADTKDSKVTVEDLQKLAVDASKGEDLKKAAARLAADPEAFARLDTGGYAGNAKDGALSQDDLDRATRTLGLVPARKEGDPQIYLVPTSIAQELRRKLNGLRELSLLGFDPQKVTRLSIQAGGKKTVVTKDGSSWKLKQSEKLPSGFEFDPSRVEAQLNRLRLVRASRWLETPVSDAEAGLDKPSAVVEFALEGGGSQSLRFGKEAPSSNGVKELFVKGSADSAVYAIPVDQRSVLETGVELFKKLPAPPEPTASMQGLESLPPELRKQIEAQLSSARPHP